MEAGVDATKLVARLDKYITSGNANAIKQAVIHSCALVETQAKKNLAETTNGTGELMQSITSNIYDTYGEVGTNVPYAV